MPTSTQIDQQPLPETAGGPVAAGADVVNLFASFGAAGAASAYQEIHSDMAARTAAARWPLFAEWLAVNDAASADASADASAHAQAHAPERDR